jgi:hypothetical protein
MNLAKSLIVSDKNFEYVKSLSLRGTHRLEKEKNETPRTFAVKKGIFHPLTQPASLIDLILKSKACYSILIKESNYCPQRVSNG